jgi:hypothetical protein
MSIWHAWLPTAGNHELHVASLTTSKNTEAHPPANFTRARVVDLDLVSVSLPPREHEVIPFGENPSNSLASCGSIVQNEAARSCECLLDSWEGPMYSPFSLRQLQAETQLPPPHHRLSNWGLTFVGIGRDRWTPSRIEMLRSRTKRAC